MLMFTMFEHKLWPTLESDVAQCLGFTCLNPVFVLQPIGYSSWPLSGKPVDFYPRAWYQEQCKGVYTAFCAGCVSLTIQTCVDVLVMMNTLYTSWETKTLKGLQGLDCINVSWHECFGNTISAQLKLLSKRKLKMSLYNCYCKVFMSLLFDF